MNGANAPCRTNLRTSRGYSSTPAIASCAIFSSTSRFGFEIDDGASLVPGIRPPEQRTLDVHVGAGLAPDEGALSPRRRSIRGLDAHDVGSQVRKHHPAQLTTFVAEIEHPNSVQHRLTSSLKESRHDQSTTPIVNLGLPLVHQSSNHPWG